MKKSILFGLFVFASILILKPSSVFAAQQWYYSYTNINGGSVLQSKLFNTQALCDAAVARFRSKSDANQYELFECQSIGNPDSNNSPSSVGTPTTDRMENGQQENATNGTAGPAYNPVNNLGNTPYNPNAGGTQYNPNAGGTSAAPTSSGCPKITKLSDLICEITWLLNRALYFIFALAFLVFLNGVYKYVKKGGDEKARKEGANFMWYGIVSLAVMFSVWGLVNFVLNTFGLSAGVVPNNIQNVIQGK